MSKKNKSLEEIMAELEAAAQAEENKPAKTNKTTIGNVEIETDNPLAALALETLQDVMDGRITPEEGNKKLANAVLPEVDAMMSTPNVEDQLAYEAGEMYDEVIGFLNSPTLYSKLFNVEMIAGMMQPSMLAMTIDNFKSQVIAKVYATPIDQLRTAPKEFDEKTVRQIATVMSAIENGGNPDFNEVENYVENARQLSEDIKNISDDEYVDLVVSKIQQVDSMVLAEFAHDVLKRVNGDNVETFATNLQTKISREDFQNLFVASVRNGHEIIQQLAQTGTMDRSLLSSNAAKFDGLLKEFAENVSDSLKASNLIPSKDKTKKLFTSLKKLSMK